MTIKDIARISGYGVSTVSRALNGHPDVSGEARDKIRQVAEENCFVPNSNARQLKITHSKSVVVIVKGEFNVFFSRLIEKIQSETGRLGYYVQLHYIKTEQNEVSIARRLCAQEKPLGIIFLGGNIRNFEAEFEQITLPCVLCSTSAGELRFPNLASVSVDDADGGERAIDLLLDSGHRRIGIIGGDIEGYCSTGLRYGGCMSSFKKHGLKFEAGCFEYASFDFTSGYAAAKELLRRNKKLTAIFAMADTMAVGAIRAVNDLGLRVPEDVSVIGFDGIELADFYTPRITTFRQSETELAETTVRMLRELIDGTGTADNILIKAEMQRGESLRVIE